MLAKQAGGRTGTTGFEVTNVNAHSLGVEGIEQETIRKTNVILIPRNTPPCPPNSRSDSSPSRKGSDRSSIKVLEGESSLPGECTAIGRTVVRDLPAGLPKGWPVEVTFEYGANGRLSVRPMVPGTHHQAELDLERDVGLSGAGMARWKVPISTAGRVRRLRVGGPGRRWRCPAASTVTGGSSGILSGTPQPATALPAAAWGRSAGHAADAGHCRRCTPTPGRCRRCSPTNPSAPLGPLGLGSCWARPLPVPIEPVAAEVAAASPAAARPAMPDPNDFPAVAPRSDAAAIFSPRRL